MKLFNLGSTGIWFGRVERHSATFLNGGIVALFLRITCCSYLLLLRCDPAVRTLRLICACAEDYRCHHDESSPKTAAMWVSSGSCWSLPKMHKQTTICSAAWLVRMLAVFPAKCLYVNFDKSNRKCSMETANMYLSSQNAQLSLVARLRWISICLYLMKWEAVELWRTFAE